MKFGAITNSWREHLKTTSLMSLVGEAVARGAQHIELRQTCLGNCESGEGENWTPHIDRLKSLTAAYPNISFNLAVAYPCLSQPADPQSPLFQSMLDAAAAVSPESPHLRMVDPAPFQSLWQTPSDIPDTALSIAALVSEASARRIVLSIENSGQPIRSLAMLVREVRTRLPAQQGQWLGLCPDPTNQLRIDPTSDPVGEVADLPLDMIKTTHFKQTLNGNALPTVTKGDVDCLRMLQSLRDKGYTGAAIMEIPPHEQVFHNLSASFAFLSSDQNAG